MKIGRWISFSAGMAVLVTLVLFTPDRVFSHCDGMDGPVVKAAEKALAAGDVNRVLIWVQKKDEAVIRKAFEETMSVRTLGPEAKALADRSFFEALVRVHRAGEGAPYTGLKPAGRDLGPAIPAADKALAEGKVDPLVKLLVDAAREGIRERFQDVSAKKNFDAADVEAGREYVKAYVGYVHYVERLYETAAHSAEGHDE